MQSRSALDNMRSFIYWWNANFPLDRWWRKKYNVAFNSTQHRESCLLDMMFEYEEEKLYLQSLISNKKEDKYIPGTGNWLKKRVYTMTNSEIKDIYDSIDIENIQLDGKKLIIK